MSVFDKYPQSRPVVGRDLRVKLTVDGIAVKGLSGESKQSGGIIIIGDKLIDSNTVAYWQYSDSKVL
jgi:hypothetical protein